MRSARVRKDDFAVSPVIAIILMVAITVVLTGVLYIWVTSMADTDSEDITVVTFHTSLHESTRTLTLEMRTGEAIIWQDHKLTIQQVNNASSFTVLEPGVNETKVGEKLEIYLDEEQYPKLPLTSGRSYKVQLSNMEKNQIVWEQTMMCMD